MKSLFSLMLVSFLVLIGSAHANDITGSSDHPMITRYPDSVIRWYQIDNYRPYRVPVGPVTGYQKIDDWIETEGRLTRIYYTFDGGGKGAPEIYKNYQDAISKAGFEILLQGYVEHPAQGTAAGSRQWRQVLFRENSWTDRSGAVNEMTKGSPSTAGGGSVVAKKERPQGQAYVVVSVYQFRAGRVGILVDILEQESAKTDLISVDAEAIGRDMVEKGRMVLDGPYFDFDKATLQSTSKPALEQITIYLKENPNLKFYVVGHTDSKGSFSYNLKLSQDRAHSVVKVLSSEYGVPPTQIEAHGVGPLNPVFSNSTNAGREKNRRVELVEREFIAP